MENATFFPTVDQVMDHLIESMSFEYCPEYGEPGYEATGIGVLLGNWSRVPRDVQDYLTQAGLSLEWYDEWTIVHGKAYRIAPDSYSWQCSIQWSDEIGDYLTPNDDSKDWIHWAENCPDRALPGRYVSDLIQSGYHKLNCDSFEYGHHYGQNDWPENVFNGYKERFESIIFVISEVCQFYIRFDVYVKGEY